MKDMKLKTAGAGISFGKTLAILFLAIMAIAAPANAEQGIALDANSIQMCPCGTARVIATVQSAAAGTYTLSSGSTWATIAPATLSIPASGTESAYVYITPDCNTPPGTYPVKISAASDAGAASATVNIDVLECHGASLVPDSLKKGACMGENATFALSVANTGKTSETFALSADYGFILPEEVSLGSGETKKAALYAAAGKSPMKITVTAASTSSYARKSIILELLGEACYSPELLIAPGRASACEGFSAEYNLTLKNAGTRDDEYVLSSDSGKIREGRIGIRAGEEKTVILEVPTENKSRGESEFTVTLTSISKPYAEARKTAGLVVENCYSLSLSAENEKVSVCPGMPANYLLAVKNTGKLADNYTLRAEAGMLNESSFGIPAGEMREIAATFGTMLNESKEREMTITAGSQKANASVKLGLGFLDFGRCYDFEVSAEPKTLALVNITKGLFVVSIKNTGTEALDFALKLDGPEWAYLDPKDIKIPAGGTGQAYVYAAPIYGVANGEYAISVRATNNAKVSRIARLIVALGNQTPIISEAGAASGKAASYSSGKVIYAIIAGIAVIAAVVFLPGALMRKKEEEPSEYRAADKTEIEPDITAFVEASKEEPQKRKRGRPKKGSESIV